MSAPPRDRSERDNAHAVVSPESEPVPAPKKSRAGRNLPAAILVGVGLLGIVGASLYWRPEPFVLFVVLLMWAGLWELRQAFARRNLRLPMVPCSWAPPA